MKRMQILIIYNKDLDHIISKFGRQNEELYAGETIDRIAGIFKEEGADVRIIDGNMDVFESIRDAARKKNSIPFVFNLSYGIQGESRYAHIPAILEMLGLPYLGSGPLGHALALDKIISKILMNHHDIPTPGYTVFNDREELGQDIDFPVILKPSMEASSFGLKVVNNEKELNKSVLDMLDKYQQPVLAEQYIEGREFALALWGNGTGLECLPLVENKFEKEDFYTEEDKKQIPDIAKADISPTLQLEIQKKALCLFRVLRLHDYARADITMDKKGNVYFLEINSMAGIQPTGFFAAAARHGGYSYDEMISKLLELGVKKYIGNHQKLKLAYESRNK